jgi:biopolymer transport protein ExbB
MNARPIDHRKASKYHLLFFVSLCLCGFFSSPSRAQDAPANETDSTSAETAGTTGVAAAKKPPGNLWEMIVAGGPMNLAFMGFLGMISLVAAAVAFERLANLTRGKIVPPGMVQGLGEMVRTSEHRLEKYQSLCDGHPSPLANVLRAGLLRAGRPLPEVEKALEDAAAREMAELRARVRPLSVAANVAPMVGLLGTVVGMLEAFRVASQAGLGKAELLAEGIYLALETTVAGLLIAIPAMLCASYFSSRGEQFVREIGDRMTEALPVLTQVGERGSRSGTANPLMGER